MTPDEKNPTPVPATDEVDVIEAAVDEPSAEAPGPLNTTRGAFGTMHVAGDARVSGAVGMLSAKGNAKLKRGGAGAIMAEGDVKVSQGGAGLIMGKRISVKQGGGGVMVGSETTVRRGWIGLLVARKAEFSEDSRVVLDWKAALILAAVLLGIFGVVAVVGVLLARQSMRATAELRSRHPRLLELSHLPGPPHLPEWVHTLEKLRHSA